MTERNHSATSLQLAVTEAVQACVEYAAVGDALARLLRAQGAGVTTEYYINDAGRQFERLALSLEARVRQFVGEEVVNVSAGRFDALHFRFTDIPGLPLEHPPYDLWCTADNDYVLLKAAVGGYMQTAYELSSYDLREEQA